MGSILVTLAVFAPLLAALFVAATRPAGLGAGRIVTVACGTGAVAAIAALIMSGVDDNGLVGDVAGLDLQLDRPSAILLAIAVATGTVVASFARRNIDVDPRAARFFTLFGILVTGSALVVVPGGPIALIAGWFASTWALIGLIGHRGELVSTRRAQRQTARALIVGDVALLLAVIVTISAAGADAVRNVGAAVAELESTSLLGASAADVVAILLVIAGASRSALVPFHRWLVSTLAAPTPVSALVHAGFVSAAGLLLIRFGPLVVTSFAAAHLAFALGVITVLVALGSGSTRVDVKGKLAWSTVAQMGFMVVQCAVGAFSSAVFHIAGHGMYKASLFLGAGDAVSASLRSSRRTSPLPVGSSTARIASTLLIATATVAVGMLIIPPDVNDSGVVLIAVFAWLTVAHGVWGWLERGSAKWPQPIVEAAVGASIGVLGYLGGLRAVEYFLKPSFDSLTDASSVSVATLSVTLAVVAVLAALWSGVQSPAADTLRASLTTVAARTAHPAISGDIVSRMTQGNSATTGPRAATMLPVSSVDADAPARARIRADVARASNVIAPTWPLTSVVAVNPLGGLEQLGFEGASAVAREQLRGRTYLTLEEYQRDHAQGVTSLADVRWAIQTQFLEVCATAPVQVAGRSIDVAEIIEADMLHSPEPVGLIGPRTAAERVESPDGPAGELIDASISHSVAQFINAKGSSPIAFLQQAHNDAIGVSSLRHLLTLESIAWLRGLTANPAGIIAESFAVTEVGEADRVAEMRGHLSRLQGWAGYAKWRSEWAHADEQRPALSLIELVAARSALEAALFLSGSLSTTTQVDNADDASTTARLDAIAQALDAHDPESRKNVAEVVAAVGPFQRHEAWLRAQERSVDDRLLSTIENSAPAASPPAPDAQLVFCIDVRSEGLRRNLEATGAYETIGFAGFFGVAMSVRRLEWAQTEARCPVLVAPAVTASERPLGEPDALAEINQSLTLDRRKGGAVAVTARTKAGLGAPFVMAEAAGWVTGPMAAARTLLPRRAPAPANKGTTMELERGNDSDADLNQRVFIAEAVLRTMGLISGFAPLVVLCGHTSHNTNNPHATALDCGACAGASGQDNARTVATLLNDAEVRNGLRGQGIDIPDGTHFVGGLHETVTDSVEILDLHSIGAAHAKIVERLTADLEVAAQRQAAGRSQFLPGPAQSVRQRGTDWAQVRPEWGLARNSSFIIGPRTMTEGLDLEGRSFLHTYDAANDPDGKVLETIMTAPLVVAHWISSQYYFSTVDREVFGAGDKLIHNVVGNTAVISGESGDLRVGLPNQSTHLGDERHHQAVRLLAVIQAPLERIENIIQQHPILTTLTAGSWIRIAGREHAHEKWSLRTPNGTWNTEPQPVDTTDTLETS